MRSRGVMALVTRRVSSSNTFSITCWPVAASTPASVPAWAMARISRATKAAPASAADLGQLRAMFGQLRAFAERDVKSFANASYYDYFLTAQYAETCARACLAAGVLDAMPDTSACVTQSSESIVKPFKPEETQ